MTSLQRSRRVAHLILHAPSIALVSLIYSAAIHVSSVRADLLDVADPWWVVTLALILLLSPVLHIHIIATVDSLRRRESLPSRLLPMEVFGDLVLGELIVNALVVLGSVLFLLPGIYVGLRSIYYKQSIILHKARPVDALRESFALTVSPRAMLQVLLLLAVSYTLPLVIDYWLSPATQAWWIHPIGILVSATFIAWINVYVTVWFGDLIARDSEDRETQSPHSVA